MFDVAVCSYFRDSQVWHGRVINQVDAFFAGTQAMAAVAGAELTYYVVEGNSRDDTRARLDEMAAGLPVTVLTQEVAGSDVASVVDARRFKNLSALGNAALRPARDAGHEFVLWTESDLVHPVNLLADLLASARKDWWAGCLGVAPVPVFHERGRKLFYDTWAFEGAEGERWGNHDLARLTNWHPASTHMPVRSFGSLALLNGHALRAHALDFREGCFPALCAAGRAAGLSLYARTDLEVRHPSAALVAGRLV